MPEISKITLPTGVTYAVKDEYARQTIEAMGHPFQYHVSTSVADTPNTTTYQGQAGTLVPTESTEYIIYLVLESASPNNTHAEWITIKTGGAGTTADPYTYAWEKIGTTATDLSNYLKSITYTKATDVVLGESTTFTVPQMTVTFTGGTTDEVLGSGTTFTVPAANVTYANAHTKDKVLGEATTFSVTNTAVTVTPSTTNIKATASGTAVGVATSSTAITGLGEPSTEQVIKSYSGETKKLATTTITGTNGTVSIPNVTGNTNVVATKTVFGTATKASKATAGTAKNVASAGTAVTVGTGAVGSATTTFVEGNTVLCDVSVSGEVLSLGWRPLNTTTVVPAVANGTITPYTFADVTVPVVSSNDEVTSSKVTLGTAISAAKVASSATRVATGSVNTTDTYGGEVMTGLGTATAATVVTGYEDTSSDTFAKTIKVTAQPTVALATGATAATGVVSVATGISSAALNSNAISVGTNDKVDAITALATGSVAQQNVTVGTNDKVTAVTGIGTGTTKANQAVTVGTNDKVTALTSATTVVGNH